jgi:hypothetical protein
VHVSDFTMLTAGHQVTAFEATTGPDLVPVEVLCVGTRRPARVLVRFLDSGEEGHEGWVRQLGEGVKGGREVESIGGRAGRRCTLIRRCRTLSAA